MAIAPVKGAAPLFNLSAWELRFGGFTWGWGPGWRQLAPNSIGKTQVLALSAADVRNHLLASLR